MDPITYIQQTNLTYETPIEGQTLGVLSQAEIDALGYPLSVRNHRNICEIPIEKSQVYLNFVAKKTFLFDTDLNLVNDYTFTYFVDDPIFTPDPFSLPNGIIYRCLNGVLTNLRNYTHYIMEAGVARQIPNYKTLEVMLEERGLSYSAVRAVDEIECAQIQKGPPMPDRSGQWSENLAESSGYNTITNVAANLAQVQSLINNISGNVAQQQQNLNNQLSAQQSAMAAQQAAAQAQAQAAKAAADKAKADAAAAAAGAAQTTAVAAAAQMALIAAQQAVAQTQGT